MGVVLANLPGDLDDVVYVLLNELPLAKRRELEGRLQAGMLQQQQQQQQQHLEGRPGAATLEGFLRRVRWLHPGCSNFGAWGGRTAGGALFSGRNLDWTTDTGVNANKLVTVWHPPEAGRRAHATVGFAGIIGAIAGMSSAGLTVHEANLESDRDSFLGFPWTLRLRDLMERAGTLPEATDLWGQVWA